MGMVQKTAHPTVLWPAIILWGSLWAIEPGVTLSYLDDTQNLLVLIRIIEVRL